MSQLCSCHSRFVQRHVRCRQLFVGSDSSGRPLAAAAVAVAARPLEACQEHDVLQITTAEGSNEWVEVVQGWSGGSCTLLRKGQLVQLAATQDDSTMQLRALGRSEVGQRSHCCKSSLACSMPVCTIKLWVITPTCTSLPSDTCAVACQAGGYPSADSLTVTSFPQLGQVLAGMHECAGE